MTGKIFNIQSFSTHDGPGIRTVVFFQGCNLHCRWCHNPESWETSPPLAFIKEKCIHCGACKESPCPDVCYAGALICASRTFSPQELWTLLAADKPYFDNGAGGVTFSGGECMLQVDFLTEIIKICRKNGVHTAVDTAGHVPYQWLVQANPDLFLYDIKAISPERHKALTGVDGTLIWENLRRLIEEQYNVNIRVPCIPKANWDELPAIGARLREWGITNTEPLPYHRLGEGKALWHGREMPVFVIPSEADMAEARRLLRG